MYETDLLSDFEVGADGAALHDDLLTVFLGNLDDLDHTLELGREGTDDEAARDGLNDVLKRVVHLLVRNREAVNFGVGGVADKEKIVLLADVAPLFNLVRSRDAVVVVELQVAGHDDVSIRRADKDAH